MKQQSLLIPSLVATTFFLFIKDALGSSESNAGHQSYTGPMGSPRDYIRTYLPFAKSTETYYGIPTLVTLAQGGIESAWGASDVAENSNNHFGIKADRSWSGSQYKGYRAYGNVQDSYNDHGRFLTTNPRYDGAFSSSDPFAFIQAVAAAGYSENPAYADVVSKTMVAVSKLLP